MLRTLANRLITSPITPPQPIFTDLGAEELPLAISVKRINDATHRPKYIIK